MHLNHRHMNGSGPKVQGHDLGIMGVLIHVIGDAINNVGVIIAALVIWLAKYDGRFYADPGVSIGIALLILASAIPLGKDVRRSDFFFTSQPLKCRHEVKNSGSILLESVPLGVDLGDIQHDLETVSRDRCNTIRQLTKRPCRFPAWCPSTSSTYGGSTRKKPSLPHTSTRLSRPSPLS